MLKFIPSSIDFEYDSIYRALVNKSGRMQYYRIKKGQKRQRISKSEFLNIYNKSRIVAIKPIQNDSYLVPIQMDLYIREN